MKNKINIPIQTIIITVAFIACLALLGEAIAVYASSNVSSASSNGSDEIETVELSFITVSSNDVNAYLSAGAFAETDSHNFDSYIYTSTITDNLTVSENDIEDEDFDEYYNLAIAHPDTYVNVRQEASTDSEVVGYIYRGAVGTILDSTTDAEGNEWLYITSGNVTGYIFKEYFYSGQEAADRASDYLTVYATIQCSRLNVREEASADSSRIGYIENGEKVVVKEDLGDWLIVEYSEDSTGYVAAEYVSTSEEFTYARTIEEDNKIKEEEAKLKARKQEAETQATAETLTASVDLSTPPATTYTSNAELRQSIVANAMQYLGNPYVHGGATLAGGTDCSGFTSLLYAQYGIGLSRIPQGQYTSNGRSVSYAEAQPGDIVCYSSNGSSCTHVALYIGNGQIIHSSTPRRGVITASITSCGTILAIKNVID